MRYRYNADRWYGCIVEPSGNKNAAFALPNRFVYHATEPVKNWPIFARLGDRTFSAETLEEAKRIVDEALIKAGWKIMGQKLAVLL